MCARELMIPFSLFSAAGEEVEEVEEEAGVVVKHRMALCWMEATLFMEVAEAVAVSQAGGG